MICSIPNPPMDKKDISRFRENLEKHFRNDFTLAERREQQERSKRSKTNAKRIIENCGGKNPILGY